VAELPVGAGTDRVSGSINFERAIRDGERSFEPGVLAGAHRGILYVDEVNLLPDHLADLLLDAAALGFIHVERDGISVRHPARFLLVGTMNPEEGELRPQLLDRYGITVEVKGNVDVGERVEVVRRRLSFEAGPEAFCEGWANEEASLGERVHVARTRVDDVVVTDPVLERISQICLELGVDGLRADIVMARTAAALAAWEGREQVDEEDVDRAARLALPHRRRRAPLDEVTAPDSINRSTKDSPEDDGPPPPPPGRGALPEGADEDIEPEGESAAQSEVQEPGPTFEPIRLEARGSGRGAPGSRSRARSERGHSISDRESGSPASDISIPATLRAAAPHQRARRRGGGRLIIQPSDLRSHVREGREANVVLFVVDASASMGARRRMSAVKGAAVSLLLDAYRRRDKVAVITFSGRDAQVMLAPTRSIQVAGRCLEELPVGGKTPLAAALQRAHEVVTSLEVKDPHRSPLIVLITDGRANEGGSDPISSALDAARNLRDRQAAAVVVTTDRIPSGLSISARIAAVLQAPLVALEEIDAHSLTRVVSAARRAA
jgi:magnesium chelatase subunit D